MKIKGLFELRDDDNAVSPVIGVILMVAITVILAAVIGTFVLGLGQEMNKNAPTAQISFSQSAGNNGGTVVTINHDGGDKLVTERISLKVEGTGALSSTEKDATDWNSPEITAGDSITVGDDGTEFDSTSTIKVIWTSEDGGTSQVIAEYDVN